MTPRQRYREFLKSDFWKELSAKKKELVKKCQRCGSKKSLQCHHVEYPKDWFQTTLEQLEVLCRRCHKKEHGINTYPFMIHRDDVRFSAILHRCACLRARLFKNQPIRDRDRRFLDNADRLYPPEPKDTCMAFQVEWVRKLDRSQQLGQLA